MPPTRFVFEGSTQSSLKTYSFARGGEILIFAYLLSKGGIESLVLMVFPVFLFFFFSKKKLLN